NLALKDYCQAHSIPVFSTGKLVVTQSEDELSTLFELEKRGKLNGVEMQLISEKEATKIEPHARTYAYALYSPATATVDPKVVCQHLIQSLQDKGVVFFFNTPYVNRTPEGGIYAGKTRFFAKTYINAAGLYADKIARDFKAGSKYCIIPFKGIY